MFGGKNHNSRGDRYLKTRVNSAKLMSVFDSAPQKYSKYIKKSLVTKNKFIFHC